MSRASIPYLMADRCSGSFWGVDVGVSIITNHRDVFCVSRDGLGANRFAGCDPEHTFGASAMSLAGGGRTSRHQMEIMKIAEASERELHLLRRSLRPTDQFEMFMVHDHVWQKAGMGDRAACASSVWKSGSGGG